MTKDIIEMPTEQMVSEYVALCLDEDDATLRNQTVRANRAVRQRMKIESVLRARGIHARRALLPLLRHPSAQVRLNSAKELLAVVPVEARATLEELAAHGPGDQRGSAGMCLLLMDKGTFKPT
jgi:Domain of unknown function (DUF2019)